MTHAHFYLSPEALGIAPVEHEGLRQLADDLDAGRIEHWSNEPDAWASPTFFSMEHWSCGSVCCIGGWLQTRGQLSDSRPMVDLFYPPHDDDFVRVTAYWKNITPAQAAAAIRCFLATGSPQWRRVLGLESVE